MDIRNIVRISQWEVSRNTPALSPKLVVGVLFALLLVGASLGIGATTGAGGGLSNGLYEVGVSADSPYYGAVASDPVFTIKEPSRDAYERGEVDILIQDGTVYPRETQKGQAALTELQDAVNNYNDRLADAAGEGQQATVYPVSVQVEYLGQTGGAGEGQTGGETDGSGTSGEESSGDSGTADTNEESFSKPLLSRIFPSSADIGSGESGTPSSLSPPFPFQSVVLALLFIVPMNFVAQTYASNMMSERTNNRGELLLVSPVSPGEIIIGKTLPYLAGMIGVASIIAYLSGGSLISVAAVTPFAVAFLGSVFIATMLSRSYKELTFVTVAVSIGIIAYAFVPAMFTNVHPIAIISPLTVVVQDLDGSKIVLAEFLFATIPLSLVALSMFIFGAGLYREEDLFRQRPLPQKALDALANRTKTLKSVPLVTIALMPFVFAGELLLLAALFAFPPDIALVVLFLGIAFIEETSKSIHLFSAVEAGHFGRSLKTGVVLGTVSGVAFFFAEKITTITQLVGLQNLGFGQAAFSAAPQASGALSLLALLLAPLALHVVTAVISSIGASRGKLSYLVGYLLAVALHAAYNLTAVNIFG